MPISFTRRGRYRLSRNGVEISQHNVPEEAYENAFEDAERDGNATYRIDPPYVEFTVPVTSIGGRGTAANPAPNPPPPDPPSGDPLFFDDFNYAVARTDSKATKEAAFAAAGWTRIFDEMTFPGSSGGYISTATSIPGFGGSIPGATGRMLRLEATVGTSGVQNDLHLQLGNGTAGDIPANVWFQHWIYINRSGAEMSDFINIRNKWLYPLFGSNSGYPMATVDTAWLCDMGNTRYSGSSAITAPTAGAMTFRNHAEPSGSGNRAWMTDQVSQGSGQQMTPRGLATENDHWLFPNTWYLVKYNMDVSGASGSHRIWWRAYGEHATGFGNPRSDWRVGVTSGFTYDTVAADRLGAKYVRMPVTVGTTGGSGANYYIYLADFAMGDAEADLPTYGSY